MDSDDLVRSLVADLVPVRRLRSIDARAARWAGLALAWVCVGAYALGTRSDLPRVLRDPTFLAESAALACVFIASARGAFRLSVPGAERFPFARIAAVAALTAWALLVARRWSPAAGVAPAGGWTCVGRMLALSLVPAAAMFHMLRKAAPRARAWTGCLAALAASALAMVGTQLVCARDDAGHVLVWHVAPVVTAALACAGAGRLLLGE